MSNIRHKGPSTSLTFTIGIIKYNTSAITEKKRFQNVKHKGSSLYPFLATAQTIVTKIYRFKKYEVKAPNFLPCNPPAHQLSENLKP